MIADARRGWGRAGERGADLEEHGGEVVGVLGDPGLLPGQAVARGLVRIEVLEVLQVRVLAVDVGLSVVPCAR